MLNFMRRAGKWIWANTDFLTKWLQAAALIGAAGWTIYHFSETEAPALHTPLSVSSQISDSTKWNSMPQPGYCWVVYRVEVKNEGLKTLDVAKLELRHWHREVPITEGPPLLLNFPEFETSEAKPWAPESLLKSRFAPKMSVYDDFTWTIKGRPAPGLHIFRVDLKDKSGRLLGTAGAWTDALCQS